MSMENYTRKMSKVFLDSLIRREDFEEENSINSDGTKKDTVSISDLLEDNFFLQTLRKPDFQRETNEWDEKKITDFVQSFITNDLIPAIILWRSKNGVIFVIDGAHRLSALIAWINDDYGDGVVTKKYYDGNIPQEQIDIANKTRKHINKIVGQYRDYKNAGANPDNITSDFIKKHYRNLASIGIQLQWVAGDSKKAEHSFININQKSSPINKTELELIEGRAMAVCIVARSIVKGGTGYRYWSAFDEERQDIIKELAKSTHDILFSPSMKEPIKTLDIPMGGKSYQSQTLKTVYDIVQIICDDANDNNDDSDGTKTINILQKIQKTLQVIHSTHASSLGLHPAVYFYSRGGKHKPTSLYAIIILVMRLKKEKKLPLFIKCRKSFEELLLNSDDMLEAVGRVVRGGSTAYNKVAGLLYDIVIEMNKEGGNFTKLIQDKYKYTYAPNTKQNMYNNKSAVFMANALSGCNKCSICNGYLHKDGMSFDHVIRKIEGGGSEISNLQLTHPYCNTGIKS